jgi:hypothetical protein
MGNELPIPPELQYILEKRSAEDRRQSERRSNETTNDAAHDSNAEADESGNRIPGNDRRQTARRPEDHEQQ